MDTMDSYKVDLKGMAEGAVSHRSWVLEDAFFSAVGGMEIKQGRVCADVCIECDRDDSWDIEIALTGTVKVECDRCLGLMDQPIRADESLRVRLGADAGDDGEVITVEENPGVLDLAWYLYEVAALAIPIRHVHEGNACDEGVMRRLGGHDRERTTDPRWAELAKLKSKSE